MISVIIPVFNAEKHLRECIESILNQTYYHLEIILVDDGSTDDSLNIINSYNYDKRIIVIHQENRGVQFARQEGLEKASGDYITFVDSDDVLSQYAYEKCIEIIHEYNCDMCVFRYREFVNRIRTSPHKNSGKWLITGKNEIYDNYMSNRYMGGYIWNKVWKRDCICGMKFSLKVSMCEDALFVWNSLSNIRTAVIIEDELYFYRYNLEGLTRKSLSKKYWEALEVWDYLQNEAARRDCQSIEGIQNNKARWTIKLADCLTKNREKIHERLLIDRFKEIYEYKDIRMEYKITAFIFLYMRKMFFYFVCIKELLKRIKYECMKYW